MTGTFMETGDKAAVQFDGDRVVVRIPRAVLVLSRTQYIAALRAGKYWRREKAVLRRAERGSQASPEAPGGPIAGGCDENPLEKIVGREGCRMTKFDPGEYLGHFQIREWVLNEEGETVPTKKGMRFRADLLPRLLELLGKAGK